MAAVSVFIRVRPDPTRSSIGIDVLKRRISEAVARQHDVQNLSFPPVTHPEPLIGERPLEEGVSVDGAPLDVRFDWDHIKFYEFWHSNAWVDAAGPVTRAPYVLLTGR